MTTQLATIRKIEEFQPIEGATKVTRARVTGDVWLVTGLANGFALGDLVVYFKPNTFVPATVLPWLSNPDAPLTVGGVAGGAVLSTKIRGHVSDGLIVPVSSVSQLIPASLVQLGTDVSVELQVQPNT